MASSVTTETSASKVADHQVDNIATPAATATDIQANSPSIPTATESKPEAAALEGFKPSKLKAGSDPVLDNVDLSVLIVNPNDECSFAVRFAENYPVIIEWQEGVFLTRKKDIYYVIGFTNKTMNTKPNGYLFVAKGSMETFMKDRANGTFKVTDDFQFGQAKKSGEGRFLVYHDPKRIKIHQNRYLEGLLSWVDTATETLGEIKKTPKQVTDSLKLLKSIGPLFGNDLRKMSEAKPTPTPGSTPSN